MKDDSTRNRILLAAGPIFARKGFKASTVREICDAADVNLASINYYFGDKQQLYNETVMHAKQMRVQQHPLPKWDSGTTAEERLRGFIGMILNRLVALESEPWQVRLLMREILQPSAAGQLLVDEYFRPVFEQLLTVVDDLVGSRLPDHQRNQIGFSVLGQCLHYRFAADVTSLFIDEHEFQEHFTKTQLVDHITSFSLGAIRSFRNEANQTPTRNKA